MSLTDEEFLKEVQSLRRRERIALWTVGIVTGLVFGGAVTAALCVITRLFF